MDDERWQRHVRSYAIGERCLVKDLRSGHEETDVTDLLDGDIQPFLDAALPLYRPRYNGRIILE